MTCYNYYLFTLTLLLTFSFTDLRAQACRLFSTEDNLPNTLVNDVIEDANNMIWVGTEFGLCRYDGAKFTTYLYEKGNPNSLQNNYVRTLFVDSHGRLMVGTRAGLQVYRPATDDFTPLASFEGTGAASGDITQIIERTNGEIWMSGNVPCCARFDEEGNPVLYANAFTYKVNFTESILEDGMGHIWLNRRMKELYCLKPNGEVEHFMQDGKDVPFNALYLGTDGILYGGGQKSGLFRLDPKTQRFEPLIGAQGVPYLVRDISNLDSGQLLIATDNAGLKVYNLHTGQCYNYEFDDARIDAKSQKVHAICRDHNNVLWLALYQKGVMMVPPKPQPFRCLGATSLRNSIGDKCITSMFYDTNHLIWVATDNGGLYALDSEGRQKRYFPYTGQPHTVPSALISIFEDSRHRFWYGSYSQGGGWIDENTGRCSTFTVESQEASTLNVYDFAEDHQGRIWMVSMGSGIMCYDEKRQTMANTIDKDSCRWANCCYFDPLRKTLYVGSYNGLTSVDLSTDSLTKRQYLGQYIIFSIVAYTGGRLALCTSEGLLIFDPNTGKSTCYGLTDGLPSDLIYAARTDASGLLWIATNAGLSCFNEKLHTFTNYTVNDGLQSNEFYKNAAMTDWCGRLWFGGTTGITYFDPMEMNQEGEKCQARIVTVVAGGRWIRNLQDTIFDDTSFTFEMATLPLHRTGHAIYSYSLDGDPWQSLQQGQNQISFSHITPGPHTFRYKARLSEVESEVKEYHFAVTYPWYAQWWAILLMIVLGISVLLLVLQQLRHRHAIRKRLAQHVQQQAINEAKLQFFMNIAHEIRTPMTMIVSPLQKLMASDADPTRHHAYMMMQRNADRIVGTINQLMDLRKIDKKQMKLYCNEVDIAASVKDLCESMRDVADVRQVRLSLIDRTPQGLRLWVDTSNFDKILINLLSNALKYTPAGGSVEVEISKGAESDAFPAGSFILRVTDTGEGIPKEERSRIFERFYQVRSTSAGKSGTGIGLHLTASLVKLHHGTITVEDNPQGQGTRFTVTLPLGHAHLKSSEISTDTQVVMNVSHPDATLIAPDAYVAEEKTVNDTTQTKSLVVIAEDDEEIRQYIIQELSAYCRVVACSNGKEALDYIMHQTPDLLLSDIMMPEMDGFELCRKIRSNVRLNHIPIVLLTAKADEETRLESLDQGADAFITKPFSMEVLRRTVQNLLKSRANLRSSYSGSQLPVDQVETPKGKSPDERLMERIMKVVNLNLSNPELTSELIAQEVGMSRVHLYRKLRELTNQTARNFIYNIRLAKAAELLAQKKCSVTEVAEMVGFTNASNFASMFKRMYGVSPSTYMDEHVKKNVIVKPLTDEDFDSESAKDDHLMP